MLLRMQLRLCLCSLHTFFRHVVCAVISFLLVLTAWLGFTNHTAGLSKAIDCNKCCEPVCVPVIVQLSFSGVL